VVDPGGTAAGRRAGRPPRGRRDRAPRLTRKTPRAAGRIIPNAGGAEETRNAAARPDGMAALAGRCRVD
jgi:hypothetical protein